MARKRYDGGVATLTELLLPHLPFAGAIVYPQDTAEKKALVDKKKITMEPLKSLLASLHSAQPNLSFTKHDMEATLRGVAKQNGWQLGEELTDYAETTGSRIRTACRHASQGLLKTPGTTWIRELFFVATTVASSTEEMEVEPVAEETHCERVAEFVGKVEYGYDSGTRSVWRSQPQKKGRRVQKEVTYDIWTDKSDDPQDGAWAAWLDGDAVQLPPGVLKKQDVEDWGLSTRKSHGPMAWEGTHSVTKERLWVTRRKDKLGIAVARRSPHA